MIKPKKFEQATNFLPSRSIDTATGKFTETPFHFYREPQGRYVLTCMELDKDAIKDLKQNGGLLWITLPINTFIPMSMQTLNPFQRKPKTDQGDEKKESKNPDSAGDNKQPNESDSKLSITGGALSEPDKHSRPIPGGSTIVD